MTSQKDKALSYLWDEIATHREGAALPTVTEMARKAGVSVATTGLAAGILRGQGILTFTNPARVKARVIARGQHFDVLIDGARYMACISCRELVAPWQWRAHRQECRNPEAAQ